MEFFPPVPLLPVHTPWEVARVQGEATCPGQENALLCPTPVCEKGQIPQGFLSPARVTPRDALSLPLPVTVPWPWDCWASTVESGTVTSTAAPAAPMLPPSPLRPLHSTTSPSSCRGRSLCGGFAFSAFFPQGEPPHPCPAPAPLRQLPQCRAGESVSMWLTLACTFTGHLSLAQDVSENGNLT